MADSRSVAPLDGQVASLSFRIPLLGLATSFGALLCMGACSSEDPTASPQGDAAVDDAAVRDAGLADAATLSPDAAAHAIGDLGPGLSTLIGDSAAGFVDGPRTVSLVNNPVNVVVGPSGNIFLADFDNGAVRRVTPLGETSTLVNQTGFSRPFGMAFTPSGEFFVQTDRNSVGNPTGALWKVSLGTGVASLEVDDVGRVRGVASLSDGRLALADVFAHTLQIYDPATGALNILAGAPNIPGYANGMGSAARFNRPLDVVVGNGNTIYVADSENHRIRKVTLSGSVTTVAGSGARASSDGALLAASFDTPVGLALDGDTIYVSEFGSGKIRRADAASVTTVAGSTPGFSDNDDPMQAQLHICEGLAFDAPYLYIADGNGGSDAAYHRVRRLDLGD